MTNLLEAGIKKVISTEYVNLEKMVDLILKRDRNNPGENSNICVALLKLKSESQIVSQNPEWEQAWIIENCMTNFSKGSGGFAANLVDPDNTIHGFAAHFDVEEGDEDYELILDILEEEATPTQIYVSLR